MIGVLLVLATTAFALDSLQPETEAAFYDGVHSYFSCVDCHGETDTTSTITRGAIPTVCGDCHPQVLADYEESVHWGDSTAHTVCVDCHGVHGILPVKNAASKAYRSLVCAECHIGPGEHFATGPHHAAFEKTGELACASCHSNHRVEAPTIAVVEPACEACHPTSSPAFELGQRVEQKFDAIRTKLDQAESAIVAARVERLDLRKAAKRRDTGRAAFTQARLVWHGLDEDAIDGAVQAALDETSAALAQVESKREIRAVRVKWLAIAWAGILIAVVLLLLKKRALDNEPQS